MPRLNGLDTAKRIRAVDSQVVLVFITNMAQYALNAYEVDAIDYLLKPIDYYEFYIKMKKAMRFVFNEKEKTISINSSEGTVLLSTSDIYFIEVLAHYLIFHTKNGDYKARGVMRETEAQLKPYNFVRFNNCYLANLQYVKSLKMSTLVVNDVSLPIGGRYKDNFLKKFTQYIGGM